MGIWILIVIFSWSVVVEAQVNTGVCNIDVVSSEGGSVCNTDPLVLVFNDEFDGVALDQGKWNITRECPREFNTAPGWFVDENVEVIDGELNLVTLFDPAERTFVTDWNTDPYTTQTRQFTHTVGEVVSTYAFDEGIYVARCQIPDGLGAFWPSFWMYGERHFTWNEELGIPNDVIELDVFEYWNNNWEEWRQNIHRDNQAACSTPTETGVNTDFHDYTLAWERHNIYWLREDLGLVRNTPRWLTILGQSLDCDAIPSGLKELNLDFPRLPFVPVNIILGNGIQGPTEDPTWWEEHISGNANGPGYSTWAYPARMKVDYVRFYSRLKMWGPKVLTDLTEWVSPTGKYNVHTATSFNAGGGCTLQSHQQLDLRSTDYVELVPGFLSERGSDLSARIGIDNEIEGSGIGGTGSGIQVAQSVTEKIERQTGVGDVVTGMAPDYQPASATTEPYPNPVGSGQLRLDVGGLLFSYILYDIRGVVVGAGQSSGTGTFTIDVSEIPDGLYNLELHWANGDTPVVHKVVIAQE